MENGKSLNHEKSFEQFEAYGSGDLAVRGLHRFISKSEAQDDEVSKKQETEHAEKQNINELARRAEKIEKQKVDNFIRHNQESLVAWSGDRTLRYRPSTTADTMAFYHMDGKVELPTKWFDGEYTDDELLFGCGHEISHFCDMRKNPEAYFGNFEHMESKGKELAKEYYKKHPEQGSEESMARFFAGELHTLYNCLDDIYVNKLAMDKAPAFYYSKNDAIPGLYDKVGFKDPDLTEQPLHKQMVFSLLRDEMVGDKFGESIVDDRVQKVLDIKKRGKTPREIIDTELKPIVGVLVDPSKRYQTIKTFLEKNYLELLDLALEEKNQENETQGEEGKQGNEGEQGGESTNQNNDGKQGEGQNGESTDQNNDGEQDEGGSSGDEFDPFGDMNKKKPRTMLGEHTMEDEQKVLDDIVKQDKIDKMSPLEKAKHIKKQLQEKFDREHDITPEERAKFNETVEQIGPEREKMRKFWDSLIGKSISFERRLVQEQRKGSLNIDSLIRQYPDFIEAQHNGKLDELTIYDRHQMERVVVNKPEEIDITLLVDGSVSMNGECMRVARETATLLMLSIGDFNRKLEGSRNETHSKLIAKTEVTMFGSDYKTIKDFEKTARFDETNETEIIKSVSRMQANYGSTNDAAPLENIADKITPEQKSKIGKEKLLKIVFEITDGEPDNKSETKEVVERLKSEGVLTFAFQIGYQNETFEKIWNDSEQPTGMFIGDNVKGLPDKLMQVLSNVMKGVRI